MIMQRLFILFLGFLLTACASTPFSQEGVNRSLSPALANANAAYHGQTALWGGLIIQARNLKDKSEIEVLSYSLDADGEPNRNSEPQGRFFIEHDGYLETAQYAAGRWVSVLGTVKPPVTGKVGTADYTFAMIHSRQLHLWPESSQRSDSNTQFHFGIGIGIHR